MATIGKCPEKTKGSGLPAPSSLLPFYYTICANFCQGVNYANHYPPRILVPEMQKGNKKEDMRLRNESKTVAALFRTLSLDQRGRNGRT